MHENSSPSVFDLLRLDGRTALITGGSGHLGFAMASALAEAGAQVVISSRDAERANVTAASLCGSGHVGVVLDHLDEDSLHRGFDDAVERAGKIDILINNGQQGHALDWTNVTQEAFVADMKNVAGYFLLAKRLRDHCVERDTAGSVVMIGSMYGLVGSYPDAYEGITTASPVQYHALKGGVIQMTRHLGVYWAQDNIRVNCLSPGPFPSESAPPAMVERLVERSPMKRMGEPAELKGALLLLASDAGSYITGQNLVVDGGWTAW